MTTRIQQRGKKQKPLTLVVCELYASDGKCPCIPRCHICKKHMSLPSLSPLDE